MEGVSQPHAVMFPYPAQGHINPMMQLAKRLLADGFFITFVNTDHNHQRMFRNGTSNDLLKVPNLRFEHLPDGLPASHGRFNENVIEVTAAILALPGPFAKLVKKIMGGSVPPVTCIITDSFCSWMQEVADQFSLPRVSLWTTPVHANLAYHFQSTLISEGYVPLKDKGKAASVITCIPGVAPMKLEDYVSFFLEEDSTNFLFQWHLRLCMRRPNEAAWNLGNNFAELESEAVAAFKKEVPNFLPIGPLLPETILKGEGCLSGGGAAGPSLWPEEGCEEWLAHHDKASVLYISFGSLVNMCEDELADLIRGLEESKIPFLWAVRPDQGGAALSQLRRKLDAEAVAGTASRRALLVSWAPQLAVLTHPSVGAFLTHCGWNSLVESLSAGVPILAKPGGFAEQRMNAHYVANVWQVGLRMPPSASAAVVKSQICSMLGKTPAASAFRARLGALRKAAVAALSSPQGSSYSNYRLFVEDMQRRAGSC